MCIPIALSSELGTWVTHRPAMDCNTISWDSPVPWGRGCGFCRQSGRQCQTTDSTHTWLTAGSGFPFCHEQERTIVGHPPSPRFHHPGPGVPKQGTVLRPPPIRGYWRCLETSGQGSSGYREGGGQRCCLAPPVRETGPRHRERSGLEHPMFQGSEAPPQGEKTLPLNCIKAKIKMSLTWTQIQGEKSRLSSDWPQH